MKRILAVSIVLLLTVSLAACGGTGEEKTGQEKAWTVSVTREDERTVLSCDRLPENASELESGLDLSDYYQTAYGTVIAFCVYENDPELGLEMLELMNGPDDVSAYDKAFIKDQFSQYPYVAGSYFTDTSPENDYVTETYEAVFFENMYSFPSDDSCTLWTFSSGADSERSVSFRLKPSEGKWYVSNWYGLLAGIRPPASEDKWN